MKPLTDKQKAAHQLISEHMQFLADQEQFVQGVVDRRFQEMTPAFEEMIDCRIKAYLTQLNLTSNPSSSS
jgi:hypothetical protein